jgi:hypothetical protein
VIAAYLGTSAEEAAGQAEDAPELHRIEGTGADDGKDLA